MTVLATNGALFGAVIVAVGILGFLGGVVASSRTARGGGVFSFFRGESDSTRVEAPGARPEDRHVLDPPPPESREEP